MQRDTAEARDDTGLARKVMNIVSVLIAVGILLTIALQALALSGRSGTVEVEPGLAWPEGVIVNGAALLLLTIVILVGIKYAPGKVTRR